MHSIHFAVNSGFLDGCFQFLRRLLTADEPAAPLRCQHWAGNAQPPIGSSEGCSGFLKKAQSWIIGVFEGEKKEIARSTHKPARVWILAKHSLKVNET